MKRKLAGLLAAVMVLAMGTTAFAAGSPDAGNNSGSTSGPTTTTKPSTTPDVAVGNATNTTITAVSDAVKDAAEQVAAMVSPDAEVTAVVDVTYNGVIPAGGVQIAFSLAGVQAGDNYVLLHQLADGRWEKITPDSVENGLIKATFTTLSPVAFVKLPKQDSSNAGTTVTTRPAGTTSTSSTAAATSTGSPKTGAALPVLPVLAMICVAGIAICGRKVSVND